MAEILLEAGAEVSILSSGEGIFDAAAQLGEAAGRDVHAIQADMADKTQVRQGFHRFMDRWGTIDILIANHGITTRTAAEEMEWDLWERIIQVNLTSIFMLNQLAGKAMIPQKKGKIINIASIMGLIGAWGITAYAASKGGVIQLTKVLASEWARYGLNINAIAPGFTETEMIKNNLYVNEERTRKVKERLPTGNLAEPNDMKGAALFLASDASRYVNGHVLVVDGGFIAQ
jgi:NAD(P)-dependent dehydrogenase (short-subunit alcohol dehydrogenase family)